MQRPSLARAISEVAGRDPVVAHLVRLAGPIRHRPRHPDGPFGALARSIVFQQLAGVAAQAIYLRAVNVIGGHMTAEAVAHASDDRLRAAGLSMNKLLSLRDLSTKVLEGELDLTFSARRSNEQIIESLTTVRGIGRWTAEMFLMFELRRLDVWPVDDLGVRQGFALAWSLPERIRPRELLVEGERFRPYRSVVARYCWEAVALMRGGTTPALR